MKKTMILSALLLVTSSAMAQNDRMDNSSSGTSAEVKSSNHVGNTTASRNIRKEMSDDLFKELDMDKDGKLSRKEANDALDKFFKENDSNHDNMITQEEAEAGQNKWWDRFKAKLSNGAHKTENKVDAAKTEVRKDTSNTK